MGNCLRKVNKWPAEIVPSDDHKPSPATVKLYGSSTRRFTTCYLRLALSFKPVSLQFIPSDFGSETPVLQLGSELVSGSPHTLLRYLDSKFPDPPLLVVGPGSGTETTPLVVTAAVLQHRSMRWHLKRVVRWVEDLVTRGGGRRERGNPVMGTVRMEVNKLGRSYSRLLEVMLEHAQMEERIVFSLLDKAHPGLCQVANADHARDLPIMNGIKEDIKAIGVLDSESAVYQEAIFNLSARLKTLQDHCTKHFEEEEMELLPLMEAAEVNKEQHQKLLEQCFELMSETHGQLFQFFIEGLLPHDAMRYLDLVSKCSETQQVTSMLNMIT